MLYAYCSVTKSVADILIGLLRIRKCSRETFRQELKNASIVRELHVYPL